MLCCTRCACVIVMLTAALCAVTAAGQDWPNWRGPNHDGISAETGLKTQWDSPPPITWQREIGSGFSAITCVGGRVFTCGTQGKQQVLFCFDADAGDIVWQLALEQEYRDRNGGDGPRGTPTIDEGRVYVQGARGRLCCCDAADGKVIWSHTFNSKPQWGYSGSVLIEGELALAIAGENDGPLVALNKKTGEFVWTAGSAPVGYSTPLAFTFDNRRYIAAMLGGSIIIVDPKTGREFWSKPWKTSWDVNAATPIYHDGHLFFSSGYEHGSLLLKLAHQGDALTATTVWEGQAIRAKFQTPVLYEGYLYTSDEVDLKCIDFATGQEKWSKDRIQHGTVVIANGHLFVLTGEGKLLIGKASPEGFEPTTQVPILEGRCWTIPTLCKGRLYARDFKKIVCLQLAP
jgi:outer membrane protein assembly factor BamB